MEGLQGQPWVICKACGKSGVSVLVSQSLQRMRHPRCADWVMLAALVLVPD